MILNEIYLYPEILDFGEKIAFPFKLQTRSLCNYIERFVKKEKYQTKGYNRVCFIGRKQGDLNNRVNSSRVLVVEFFLDEQKYIKTEKNLLNEYFISLILSATSNCDYPLPKESISAAIDEFREIGYKNEWVFKKKRARGKIDFSLICKLSMDEFLLNLEVAKDGVIIFCDNILKDTPNEFVYGYHLNDINLDKTII